MKDRYMSSYTLFRREFDPQIFGLLSLVTRNANFDLKETTINKQKIDLICFFSYTSKTFFHRINHEYPMMIEHMFIFVID